MTSAVLPATFLRAAYSEHDDDGLAVRAAQPTDRILVDAVLGGDNEAFRVLVDRESANVIAACRRLVGDPFEAEDVAQEAFLQAYRSLATFRGDGPFGAWVWRIAMRIALARRKRARPLQADPTKSEGWLEERADDVDPQSVALAGEQRAEMLRAISTLPEAQRRIVTMRYYGDMSLDEISDATGAPVGTVKSRLHRALAALRKHLGSG